MSATDMLLTEPVQLARGIPKYQRTWSTQTLKEKFADHDTNYKLPQISILQFTMYSIISCERNHANLKFFLLHRYSGADHHRMEHREVNGNARSRGNKTANYINICVIVFVFFTTAARKI